MSDTNSDPFDLGPVNSTLLQNIGNANLLKVQPLGSTEMNDNGVQHQIKLLLKENLYLKKEICNLKAIKKQTKNSAALKRECNIYKTQFEKLKTEFKIKVRRTQELQAERLLFVKEIQECESYITWQEEEINRLNSRIKSLTEETKKKEKSEDDHSCKILQKRILELEAEIDKKEEKNHTLMERLNKEKNNHEKMKEAFKKISKNYIDSMSRKLPVLSSDEAKVKQLEDKIEQLENDKKGLTTEVKNCENYITNHVNEMRKLAYYIDCLAQNSQRRVNFLDQIGDEVNPEPCRDTTCLCNRLEQLEAKVNRYKTKLTKQEESRKTLMEKLESEKKSKEKMEEAFMKTAHIYEELLKKNENDEINELRMKLEKIPELEKQIQNKDKKIAEYEEKLKSVLKNMDVHIKGWSKNIENAQKEMEKFTRERVCMCNRIEELETQIEDYESTLNLQEKNNNVLLKTLEDEKLSRAKVEVSLEILRKSDEHLKNILQEARLTIETITQKLEEYDIEKEEIQRDNQIKINELEDQLNVAMATISNLRGNLDEMKGVMDKNVALRTLSSQLHEAANEEVTKLQKENENLSCGGKKVAEMYHCLKKVLHQKDKTFANLKHQLLDLREQFVNEQQRRANTEAELSDMAACGDSAIAELQQVINVQNREINRLQGEVNQMMDKTPNGKLIKHVKQLEDEKKNLKEEIDRLGDHINAFTPGLNQMKAEIDKQKKDIETQRKMREDIVIKMQKQLDENNELTNKVRNLIIENEELKRINARNKEATVVIVEKEQDGGKYRYIGGMKGTIPREMVRPSSPQRRDPRSTEIQKEEADRQQFTPRAKDDKRIKDRRVTTKSQDTRLGETRGDKTETQKITPRSQELRLVEIRGDKIEERRTAETQGDKRAIPKSQDPKLKESRGDNIEDQKTAPRIQDPKLSEKRRDLSQDPKGQGPKFKELPSDKREDQKTTPKAQDPRLVVERGGISQDQRATSSILKELPIDKPEDQPKALEKRSLSDPKEAQKYIKEKRTESLDASEQTSLLSKDIKVKEKVIEMIESRTQTSIQEPRDVKKGEMKTQTSFVERKKQDPDETQIVEENLRRATNEVEDLKVLIHGLNQEKEDMSKQLKFALDEVNDLRKSVEVQPQQIKLSPDLESEPKVTETRRLSKSIATATSGSYLSKSPSDLRKEEIERYLKLETDFQNLKKELEEKVDENKKLRAMIHNLQNNIKKARSEFKIEIPKGDSGPGSSHLDQVVVTLQENITMEQKRVAELEEFWRNCENRSERIKDRKEELETENEQLKRKLDEMKTRERKKMPSASHSYINTLKGIDESIRTLEDHISEVVGGIKGHVETVSNKLAQDPNFSEHDITQLMEEIDKLRLELMDSLSKKKVSLSQELQDKHIEELEKELKDCNICNNKLQDRVAELETKGKESELPGPKEAPNVKQLKELEFKFRELERENNNLKSEVSRLRSQRKSIFLPKDESPATTERVAELEAIIHKQQDEIELLRNARPRSLNVVKSLDALHPDDPENTNKVKELQDTLKQWQTEYDREIRRLKKELDHVTNRRAVAQGCPAHEDAIRNLESTLLNCQSQQESLERKNAKLENENDRLSSLLSKYEGQAQVSPDDTGENRIRELVEHVKNLERKNEALTTQGIKCGLENDRLKNDLERLIGKDYNSLEAELQRLRDLERQVNKSQEKYQHLKRRLMKVEIENKNLKKDYIENLIAKEKILLHSGEQEKRLRETNKLLKKTQDKNESLTNRIIKAQVENENLKLQLHDNLGKEIDEQLQIYEDKTIGLLKHISELENEVEYLRSNLEVSSVETTEDEEAHKPRETMLKSKSRDTETIKLKVVQLELENEFMKRELEEMKGKEVGSYDNLSSRVREDVQKLRNDDSHLKMRAVELETENEFLKNELTTTSKQSLESGVLTKEMAELTEKMHKLVESNEQLKLKNVELEVENEYLKKEHDRLVLLEDKAGVVTTDGADYEKASHLLKLKVDNLEVENKDLKSQLAALGKQQISLEAHTEYKILKEMERLIHEYDTVRSLPPKLKDKNDRRTDVEIIAERMQEWREKYEPQLQQLRKDLDMVSSSGINNDVATLELQLQECKAAVERLEFDNRNLRIALEILLKDKPSLLNVKLTKEAEQLLQKYQEEDEQRKKSMVELKRFEELEDKLKECKKCNDFLRNEQISLESHFQDKRIRDLESQLRLCHSMGFSSEIVDNDAVSGTKKLEDLNEELRANLQHMVSENTPLKSENRSLKEDLEKCNQLNENLTSENDKLSKMNDEQKSTIAALEAQLNDCNLENEDLKEKLLKAHNNKKSVSFQNLAAVKKAQTLENEHEELKKQYAALKKDYTEQEGHVKELEQRLKKCREINKKLKKQQLDSQNEGSSSEDVSKDDDDKSDGQDKSTERDDQKKSMETDDQEKNDREKPADGEKFDKTEEVEENLSERQNSVEKLTEQIDILYKEHQILQVYKHRVKELEVRLIQSHACKRRLKVELEAIRRNEYFKQNERKIINLEKQLGESNEENELIHAELEKLRKELASKNEGEQALKQKLILAEKSNKELKNEINSFVQEKDELKKQLEEKNEEIRRFNLIRSHLEKGKEPVSRSVSSYRLDDKRELESIMEETESETKDEEINKLKGIIADLQRHNELLSGTEMGDSSIFLKEIENKNKENIKLTVIIANLKEQIEHITQLEGKGDAVNWKVRKLEGILQKYRDNNTNLKATIRRLEIENSSLKSKIDEAQEQKNQKNYKKLIKKDSHTSKVSELEELQDEIEKCRISNEDLKHVTIQLDSELKRIKNDIENIAQKEHISVQIVEGRITEFTDNLKKQYKKDIDTLARHAQMVISRVVPSLGQQAVMLGVQRPQAAYAPLWQPPFLYPLPSEIDTEKELENLQSLTAKIQETFEKSTNALKLEMIKQTEQAGSSQIEKEEREEKLVNLEIDSDTQELTNINSIDMNDLRRKQQRTRDRINNLQNKIHETMRELNDESQKCKEVASEMHLLPKSQSVISIQRSNSGRYQLTNISSSGFMLPHFHSPSTSRETDSPTRPQVSFLSRQIHGSSKSFHSVEK